MFFAEVRDFFGGSSPVEPIICVSRVREWIVTAEVVTSFCILKQSQQTQNGANILNLNCTNPPE